MKKAVILLMILFFGPMALAAQEKTIFMAVHWENGKYEMGEPMVSMNETTKTNPAGIYLFKLKDSQGQTLYQLKVMKPVDLNPPPYNLTEEEIEQWYKEKENSGLVAVNFPYLENAKTVSFERGTAILAEADLSVLCNNDDYCDTSENNLSCPNDCPKEEKDNYCHRAQDSFCDPDCGILDPDCEKEPEPEQDLVVLGLGAAIVIVIVLIVISRLRNPKK